jgi:hypothetical protein
MITRSTIFRALVLAGALAGASASAPGVIAQESNPLSGAGAPTPAQIDRNGALILIRSTLLALDHANKTGNYTVLRDLGSPGFHTNTAARLAEIFASQRKDNTDLSGVAVLEPQLTLVPQIEANGIMHMAGFFPSAPTKANFDLAYAPVDRQWRLFGLSVSFDPAGPVAPPSSEEQYSAPQAQPAPPNESPEARAAPPKGDAHQAKSAEDLKTKEHEKP